jgi:hypothetical protein
MNEPESGGRGLQTASSTWRALATARFASTRKHRASIEDASQGHERRASFLAAGMPVPGPTPFVLNTMSIASIDPGMRIDGKVSIDAASYA